MANSAQLDRLRQISSVEREFQRRAAEYNSPGNNGSSLGILAAKSSSSNNKERDHEDDMEESRPKKVVNSESYS